MQLESNLLRPYQQRWVLDESRLALAVKGAQLGYSTATAALAVMDCLERPNNLWILLSRSERQSLELAEKAKAWASSVLGASFQSQAGAYGRTSVTQHMIKFDGTGSRVIALSANPDTARGYTGNAALDEFAFHQDAEAIFRAVYRQTTLGYKVRILSTPNGQKGKFHALARQVGLDGGVRPERQPVTGEAWSGHWCDIHLAVEEGAPLDIAAIRDGCDAETFEQEYLCQFITTVSEWIGAEALEEVIDHEASQHFGGAQPLSLVAGWDVARGKDLSVLWLSEAVGDVTWTRGIVEMTRMSLPRQIEQARALMPFIRRLHLDPSSIGLGVAEVLEHEFPGRVQRVQFTSANKERLAVLAKRRIEQKKVRVPDIAVVRHSFRAIRRNSNKWGQASFDAERDRKFGHGDHFWAFALAESANDTGAKELGLVEFIKTETAKTLAKPTFGARAESCAACGSRIVAQVGEQRRCGGCGTQWGDVKVGMRPSRRASAA